MKMVVLASGGPPALWNPIKRRGHRVLHGRDYDWWEQGFHRGLCPTAWADRIAKAVQQHRPDVFVLVKGWAWRDEQAFWCAPLPLLWWIRQHVKILVYISWDDPAGTPITVREGLLGPFDHYLTTCPGIPRLFDLRTKAKVSRFWLAHDVERLPKLCPVEPKLEVDVAITGSPYARPFPPPHYQGGFACPRRRFVDAFLKAGFKVGIWGPETWLVEREGGDPSYRKVYRGWMREDQIHRVHRSARVTLGTHLVQGPGYESGRFPFVGGAGGCLVHEIRPGLMQEFRDCALWFRPGHVSVAVDRVRRLLQDPELRDRLSARLHKRVLERHTWPIRAGQFLRTIGAE